MQKTAVTAAAILGCLLVSQPNSAGDRLGVAEVLHTLPAAWPEAFFSIDVKGPTEGEAILNQSLDIEYEAAVPGYVSYLSISSHGDMTLVRDAAAGATSKGVLRYVVKPPLGGNQIIVLFSSAPLDSLFSLGENSRDIGADRASAEGFVHRLAHLQASNVKVADRRYQYVVATAPGGTEYTTRGIILKVAGEAGRGLVPVGAPGVHQSSKVSIPSHIEFEFDSDRLTEQGKRDLDEFGEALVSRQLPANNVTLAGHTDSVGSDDYNMGLSARRAQTVKRYLEDSFNIPASTLSAMGMGKEDPIAPNNTEADRQRNRRVDFVFSLAPPTDSGH